MHKWCKKKEQDNEVWIYVIVTVHHIWRVQNDVVWRGVSSDSQSLVFMIKTQVVSFLRPILIKDTGGSNNLHVDKHNTLYRAQVNALSQDWLAFNVVSYLNHV